LSEALAAGLEADAVLVAVPPGHHAPVALEALEAGLHCLIEKPLAHTLPAAWAIVRAAERNRRQVMVSQNYRWKRAPQTVRRLIRADVIGDVEEVHITFQKNPPFTGFRLEMDEPLINDMAVHHLDQVRGITGVDPDVLRARSWNPSWSRYQGNAACLIELEEAHRVRVLYTGSWCSWGRHTTWDGDWEIQGERGAIRWADNRVEVRFASLFDTVFLPGALEREGVMQVELDRVALEERPGSLGEFAAALREGRRAETDARDNLRSLALVLGAVESAGNRGATVDLNELRAEPQPVAPSS
jgi:predicted dehydrogenase